MIQHPLPVGTKVEFLYGMSDNEHLTGEIVAINSVDQKYGGIEYVLKGERNGQPFSRLLRFKNKIVKVIG